jgi:FixJ family two-component response regulator
MANLPLISVVDDDVSVRESLRGLFRSLGFSVIVLASAEEFLDSDHRCTTDCLILDMQMPGMNGPELQRRLLACHCEIPVIFITAHASDEEGRSQALKDGAVDCLLKPLSEDALLNAVHAALGWK